MFFNLLYFSVFRGGALAVGLGGLVLHLYLLFFLKKRALYALTYENFFFFLASNFFDAKLNAFTLAFFAATFLAFFNFKVGALFCYPTLLNFFFKNMYKTRFENSLVDGLLYVHPLCINFSYFFFLLATLFFLNKGLRGAWFGSWRADVSRGFFFWTGGSIILGAVWAQHELNWGGFWSWDQVEIISLFYLVAALFLVHYKRPVLLFSALFVFFYFFFGLRFNYFTSVHSFVSKRSGPRGPNLFFFSALAPVLWSFFLVLRDSDKKGASFLVFFGALFMFFFNFLASLVFEVDLKNFFSYFFIFFFKKSFLAFGVLLFWDFFFLKERLVLHAAVLLSLFFFKFGAFFDFSMAAPGLLEPSFVGINSITKSTFSYVASLAGDLGSQGGSWSYNVRNFRLRGSFTYGAINKNALFFAGLFFFNLYFITKKLYYLPSFLALSFVLGLLLL